MSPRLALLALAACADPAPVDEPAPPVVDTEPPEPPVDTDPPPDTDRPDTDPPDPCLSEPTVVQLGQIDDASTWEERVFTPFVPGQEVPTWRGAAAINWSIGWSAEVSNAPHLLRLSANLTDLATGVPLLRDRQPALRNVSVAPLVLGEPWTCQGRIGSWEEELDPRGLDDDDTVPVWQELCGRTVRLDVSLRTADGKNLAATTIHLVLAPSPYDADTCP